MSSDSSAASPITIVLATDENYVQHTGVVLLSLFRSYRDPRPATVFIVGDNLSQESRDKLQSCLPVGDRAAIDFINIDSEAAFSFKKIGHISKMMYVRLVIADLLPESIERVLYLDTDTIVRHCISALWDSELGDNTAGAVEELGFFRKTKHKRAIGLKADARYLNSGMLLIDLTRWRQRDITKQLVSYMERHPDLNYPDQDALNVVLEDDWQPLPAKWNVHKDTYAKYYSFARQSFSPERIEAILDPGIMHFTGPRKPWHYACAVPFSSEYREHLASSPWSDYQFSDRGLKSRFNRVRWQTRLRFFGKWRALQGQGR